MEKLTQYAEQDIRPCAKELCMLLANAEKNSLVAVRRKFSQPAFHEVAKIKIEPSRRVDTTNTTQTTASGSKASD